MSYPTFDWGAWQRNLDNQIKAYEQQRAQAAREAQRRIDELNAQYSAQMTGIQAEQGRIQGEIDLSKRKMRSQNYFQMAADTLDTDQFGGNSTGLTQDGTNMGQARKNAAKGTNKLAVPTSTGATGPAQSLSIASPSKSGKGKK